ncbi:hypothetical protein SG34_011165 [Thalassomonas viridans]|uniref:Uncharacterized protein n=1 Tax=Thalassomonas viridans TaxID=137584 RepID=A0AAE9Z603_9GAMM|nr:hypothetical protein [Thalassomonas viridans]WDE07391.1 hypothetical protein SG34_011165 [Thalassomonas viridans]
MDYREKYVLIRDRWDKEDSLLLTRTGIFLTVNSILLAAAQLNNSEAFKLAVAAFAAIFSLFWLLTSLHSYRIIKILYQKCHRLMPSEIKGIYRVKVLMRPNTVFGVLSPVLVLFAWLAYALLLDASAAYGGQNRERISFGNYGLALCMVSVFDDKAVKSDFNLAAETIKSSSNIPASAYKALETLVGRQLIKNYPAGQGGQIQSLKCLDLLHLTALEQLYRQYDPCSNPAAWPEPDKYRRQCRPGYEAKSGS